MRSIRAPSILSARTSPVPFTISQHRRLLRAAPFTQTTRLLRVPARDGPVEANSLLAAGRFARARSFVNRHRSLRIIVIGLGSVGVITASCVVCLLGLLAYDATTYSERNIKRIADYLVGDHDDPEFEKLCDKPKLVIIGGGWG
ncbi:hypothetical protein PCASD_24088, partial [Puccinia coronata f. sp. avenae]